MKNPIGYETSEGHLIGRDPRAMTIQELEAIGHVRMSVMDALRARCLDCCAGSASEVRKCVSMNCPAWPFRTGSNPWRAPASDAQRESARRNAARMNASSQNVPSGRENLAADPSRLPQGTPNPSETIPGGRP